MMLLGKDKGTVRIKLKKTAENKNKCTIYINCVILHGVLGDCNTSGLHCATLEYWYGIF